MHSGSLRSFSALQRNAARNNHCKDRSATTLKLSRYCKLLVFFGRGVREAMCIYILLCVFRAQRSHLEVGKERAQAPTTADDVIGTRNSELLTRRSSTWRANGLAKCHPAGARLAKSPIHKSDSVCLAHRGGQWNSATDAKRPK